MKSSSYRPKGVNRNYYIERTNRNDKCRICAWDGPLNDQKDLPSNSRIFEVLHSKAEELGIELAPTKFVCDFETALIPTIQGNYLSIFAGEPCTRGFRNLKSQMEVLFEYFQREWLPTTKIPLWNIHGVALRTNNHLEGWHSRKNYGARE
ncbi:hypothetical protein T08_16031 [Trichinella sp. T8]|nr:hypothetical protein T08_16031 [Trichinella sp. T8]